MKRSSGLLRDLRDFADANAQLHALGDERGGHAHSRHHARDPAEPVIDTEQALLKGLPSTPPKLTHWAKAKGHPDCHINAEHCRYSAPYTLAGKELDVRLSAEHRAACITNT